MTSGNSLTHVLWPFISHSRLCGKGELSHSRCQCLESYGSWSSVEAHALPSSTPRQPAIPLTPMPPADQKQCAKAKASQIPQELPSAEKHWLWNMVYKLPNRRERNHCPPVWEHLTDCSKRGPKVLASDSNIRAEIISLHRKHADTNWPHGFLVDCSASTASPLHHIGQAGREQSLAFPALSSIRHALTRSGPVPLLLRTDRWAGFCWVVSFCCPTLPFLWPRQQGSWVTRLQFVPWPCLLSPARWGRCASTHTDSPSAPTTSHEPDLVPEALPAEAQRWNTTPCETPSPHSRRKAGLGGDEQAVRKTVAIRKYFCFLESWPYTKDLPLG